MARRTAASHGAARLAGVFGGGAGPVTAGLPGDSSSSMRASATSWKRVLTLRSRHRFRTRTTAAGVSGGSTVQSGSRISTAASVSEIDSPANARRPVSIS